MEPKLCFIRESYLKKNASFLKMLDSGNISKQSKRTHLCVLIELNANKFYIPLRNNLGDEVRKFGRIGLRFHLIKEEVRDWIIDMHLLLMKMLT